MQPEKEVRTDGRRLVIGYDGGCFTCSDLAERVEGRLKGRIEVRNLRDSQVQEWHRVALGENVPLAPTLFEMKGKEVRAWTGWKLGANLSRFLGPVATWRVMQELGEVGAPDEVEVPATGSGMSRGQFLKGVSGAAAAATVLTGNIVFSSAALSQTSSTGTAQQQSLVRGIVRNSRQMANLEAQQKFVLGNPPSGGKYWFHLGTAPIEVSGRYAAISVDSVAGKRSVVAVFVVNLSQKNLRFCRFVVCTSGSRQGQAKTRLWDDARQANYNHEVIWGENYVIVDNRITTYEKLVKEQRERDSQAQSIASTSRGLQSVGNCSDAEFYSIAESRYRSYRVSTTLGCRRLDKAVDAGRSIAPPLRIIAPFNPVSPLCRFFFTEGKLRAIARSDAADQCAGRTNVIAATPQPPRYYCS